MRRFERATGRWVVRWTLLGMVLLFAGCAGLRPSPKYNRERHGGRPAKTESRKTPKETEKPAPGRTAPDSRVDPLDREISLWWGTPYHLGMGKRQIGVDCSAYVRAVFKTVYGVKLPRTAHEQYRLGVNVARANLRRGDLVFFNTSGRGVSHVGIYLGGGKFTHASNSDGVTINDLRDAYYSKRYLGARRIRKK